MLAVTPDNTELDTGPRSGSGTERLCVATRTVKPVAELIRFVIGPDGVTPDLKRKLPGRGIWVTAARSALADALARKAFARGFKREVKVPPDLVEQTERLLVRAVLDALAIAGKAGRVLAGFGKVEAALGRDRVAALIHASDAGTDGINKLKGPLLQRPDADRIAMVREFTSAQLDLALGRSNVVHAALLTGPSSDTFLARFARLERFRTAEPGESGQSRAPN
jgi:predicted RNA-binding protein YlxR (DUF448 family)